MAKRNWIAKMTAANFTLMQEQQDELDELSLTPECCCTVGVDLEHDPTKEPYDGTARFSAVFNSLTVDEAKQVIQFSHSLTQARDKRFAAKAGR